MLSHDGGPVTQWITRLTKNQILKAPLLNLNVLLLSCGVLQVTSVITDEWAFSIGLLDYSCDSQVLTLGWYPSYPRKRLKVCAPLRWCLCDSFPLLFPISRLFWS